jgi:hypothetical protein
VVHTERPEDVWWNSFSVTIGKFFTAAPSMPLPPHFKEIFQTMSGWFMKDTFGDHIDRDSAIAAYRRNNEKVRDAIPADRLLVFKVAEGWGPLCRFLEVPEPDAPFPRSHPRDEFWAHFGGDLHNPYPCPTSLLPARTIAANSGAVCPAKSDCWNREIVETPHKVDQSRYGLGRVVRIVCLNPPKLTLEDRRHSPR